MRVMLAHTWYLGGRHLRAVAREPWYIAFSLVQPVVYLLLFGALFQKVADLPGFGAGSYLTFLTPGVVIMGALYGAGWSGMGVVDDMERGLLDRLLVSPAPRLALVAARLVRIAAVTLVQSLLVVGLALLVGARFAGGPLGVAALLACAVLLAAPVSALSIGIALLMRQQESVIAAVNFGVLPLTFLSTVFMAPGLMPGWMQLVARFNPVNWAVDGARAALAAGGDWRLVGSQASLLLGLAIVCSVASLRAFDAFQRSR